MAESITAFIYGTSMLLNARLWQPADGRSVRYQGANSGVDNRTSDIRWSVPRRYTYTTPDQVIS